MLFGVNEEKMKLLKELSKEFEIMVSNNPQSFPGIEIDKTDDQIKFSQSSYTENILKKFLLQDSKPTQTPLVETVNVDQEQKQLKFPFREAVGSLLYLSNKTILDLFAVSYESRFIDKPMSKM